MTSTILAAAVATVMAAAPAGTDAQFGAASGIELPSGSLAMWARAGYPDVRAGFRQGFKGFELAAEAGFDYLMAKGDLEGIVRTGLWAQGPMRLTLELGAGGFANGGLKLDDRRNTPGAGLRFSPGATFSYRTQWPLTVFSALKVPMEVPLTESGKTRFAPTLGLGGEVAAGDDYFVLLWGGVGPDVRKPQASPIYVKLNTELSLGVGYRWF